MGAFLSGGVDSSTIVAIAQEVSGQPVRTFTVAVGGAGDESDAAARVARHLGTDHTTLPLPDVDALEMAQGVSRIYDEPFADPSGVPTALLCAAAREHAWEGRAQRRGLRPLRYGLRSAKRSLRGADSVLTVGAGGGQPPAR